MTGAETYLDLLTDLPHWLMELTVMAIFDGLIGAIVWPRVKRHIHRDVLHAEGAGGSRDDYSHEVHQGML